MESYNGNVRLQMFKIPEPDGTQVKIGFSVPEWGLDPYIRWKKNSGNAHVDSRAKYQILGYVYDGYVFERRDGMGYAGINLTNLQPIGRLENGMLSTTNTNEVKKGGKYKVRPVVFQFSNYTYWQANDTAEMTTDSNGCFVGVSDPGKVKS